MFKISRDEAGVRMTHLKVTGGSLKIRDSLSPDSEEKINQIRLYSGSKFEALKEAEPGMVVAVTGISDTRPGQVFGTASESALPLLEPVLTYRILLPFGTRLPHHAQKHAHARGGRPAAPYRLERGAWRDPGTRSWAMCRWRS